eukprot:CAMPEP_0174291686 /NCGR_PEP_ID=MMETSP0809-20121228/32905_1 /TAXON_ID=73025 ORGANISM="Eutreptiella gymnastica-like, Strain CCMP1594" /NCGR_SAMPLE_ID=MMETSP0809 /ASSEMBLY_ACC=CAM_ASM_000658 /LENGTH=48 /DNA_ID= /DNA_START= /DNA_END= /DNA_ORIENTATION=
MAPPTHQHTKVNDVILRKWAMSSGSISCAGSCRLRLNRFRDVMSVCRW